MGRLSSILVVLDRTPRDRPLFAKSVALARRFGARVQLFSCDAEHGYAFRHTYDTRGLTEARQACIANLRSYLQPFRNQLITLDIEVCLDAVCESPLYEAIVRKVVENTPDLIMKAVTLEKSSDRVALNPNDWQLALTCPVPLMLSRGGAWPPRPHIAVVLDRCDGETANWVKKILGTAEHLRAGSGGRIEVLLGQHSGIQTRALRAQVAALRRIGRDLKIGTDQILTVAGDAGTVLPAFVGDRGYHVVVLGALEWQEGPTIMIASLTRRLINALDCDFILIKPGDYAVQLRDHSKADTGMPQMIGGDVIDAPGFDQVFE